MCGVLFEDVLVVALILLWGGGMTNVHEGWMLQGFEKDSEA